MAAPAIVAWIGHHARANRVEMDVAHERQQIAIRVDQSRPVAALEQVAGRRDRPLFRPGVTGCDDAHHRPERRLGDPDRQVNVIRHPAVGEQACAVALEGASHDFLEAQVVVTGAKDGLAVVAPQHGVVQATRDVNATLAWHWIIISAPTIARA
jgi:hypothetical protein